MHIIGLDIGTTTISGICFDTQTGESMKTVSCLNNAGMAGLHEWEKLQDANVLMECVKKIMSELVKAAPCIYSIGITGQMHGIVYLDQYGKAVSPLYTWQDGRGDQIYKEGKTYARWLSEKTGYPLSTGFGAVTHFYNAVNGLVPTGAKTFCTIHDMAAMMLANENSPLLHPSNAASFGLYDLQTNQFDTNAIASVGMDASVFPEVRVGYPLVGKTAYGIPVSVAIGDNQASVFGSVRDLENSILVNVGTGSQISCVVKGIPEYKAGIDCRPLTDGLHIVVGSSLCGGRAYAILEKFLRETAMIVTGKKVDTAYTAMDKIMDAYTIQDQPLLVETTFSGTRHEPEKRGVISNIGVDNLTMPNLCDGVMNGMVKELFDIFQQIKPFLKTEPDKLIGSGNGIRLNMHLANRFSQMFKMPLRIPSQKEEAAFGAALFGYTAAEERHDIRDALQQIQYQL